MLEMGSFYLKYQEKLEAVESSVVKYSLPLSEKDVLGIYPPMYSPEHRGEFATAVDLVVADPRLRLTDVLAPCDGIVMSGVLGNDRWGTKEEDKKFLNWVHIKTGPNEFVELAHIAPIKEKILHVGDKVRRGEVIAVAGLNGRMTETNGVVDSHVHMFVGKYVAGGFKGLKISWS